jgi:hypothetical protein
MRRIGCGGRRIVVPREHKVSHDNKSLLNSHHPFDLYKVSWSIRLEEQKRLDKGVKNGRTPPHTKAWF